MSKKEEYKEQPIIRDILSALEEVFPLSYQETWDNSGLQVGDPNLLCTGVLFAVEATEATVEECVHLGYNLLITHHPILFHPLKRISKTTYIERTITLAIKNDIAIYAAHTSSDNALQGLNDRLASRFLLQNCSPLQFSKGKLYKLEVTVPHDSEEKLKTALFLAGAGTQGNYKNCCFSYAGEGEFYPKEGANPFLGTLGETCYTPEKKLSLLVNEEYLSSVIVALRKFHPYEEPAYDIFPLENDRTDVGTGLIGELPESLSEEKILEMIASWSEVKNIAHSSLINTTVHRIAIVSGSGGSFMKNASSAGCQLFLTGEAKYNDFLDAAGLGILLVTIGHFESEKVSCNLFMDVISRKFPNFALTESIKDTNPVKYFSKSKCDI